jgi:hypothetical protein
VSALPRCTGQSVAALALCLAASSCSSGHEDTVNATAAKFYAAIQSGRGDAACLLLAPETKSELEQSSKEPCDKAILEEGVADAGARRRTAVFGTMAEVRFSRDTAFLAQFDQGWKIMATACKPVPGKPFDCSVKGG